MERLTNKLTRLRAREKTYLEDLRDFKRSRAKIGVDIANHEKARAIVQEVAKITQNKLQFFISDISSLAMGAIFEHPYTINIEFVSRRNKTECDIFFEKDGERFTPADDTGVGAIDIAAFALRIASLIMSSPKLRNTIVMDEPFKHLSEDLHPLAASLLKELSNKLGIQFIIVTHLQELAQHADKVFNVKKRKGISDVTTI